MRLWGLVAASVAEVCRWSASDWMRWRGQVRVCWFRGNTEEVLQAIHYTPSTIVRMYLRRWFATNCLRILAMETMESQLYVYCLQRNYIQATQGCMNLSETEKDQVRPVRGQ